LRPENDLREAGKDQWVLDGIAVGKVGLNPAVLVIGGGLIGIIAFR
jgi:hypothetical protein